MKYEHNPCNFATLLNIQYGAELIYEDADCHHECDGAQAYDCEECPYNESDMVLIGVVCPFCGDPIYFEDWGSIDTYNWTRCPICEFKE